MFNFCIVHWHCTVKCFSDGCCCCSKVTSREITTALEAAEKTEAVINETRLKYKPYATRGSLLFFCVADLRNIEPMYQVLYIGLANSFLDGVLMHNMILISSTLLDGLSIYLLML